MVSREELLAAGANAYVIVGHKMKVPVANDTGVLTVIREFQPGDLLPRADWDRFPARSRRSMINTGFVRDPLNVELNPVTNAPIPVAAPKPSVTVLRPAGTLRRFDATGKLIPDRGGLDLLTRPASQETVVLPEPTASLELPKRKRGRPRKVRV